MEAREKNTERRRGAARSKDVGGQGGSKKGERERALQVLNPPPAVARRPRRHARPPAVSSRAVGAVRRARAWLRARACPAAAAVLAWRDWGGGSPSRQGASGRTSRTTACRRPGAPWLRGWEESWRQQWGGERWTNELRRWGGGCEGDVMDGWCVTVGRRGSQVKGERPSQGLASGSPSALVEPLSLSNEMGGGEQQATVSDGERWTTVDPQRVPQNRNSESSMPVSFRRCRFSARFFP